MQGVMLARPTDDPDTRVTELHAEGRWVFDVKWDGVRCVAHIDSGKVRLINRSLSDISHQYPEVVAHLEQMYPTEHLVLDGEMICFDPDLGEPTFNRIQIRNAQSNPRVIVRFAEEMPATFVVFDLLEQGTVDLRRVMLQGRLMLLEKVAERFQAEGAQRIQASIWSDDGVEMWARVKQYGLEGLIAKQKSSLYRPGKSPQWLKLKPTNRVTVIAWGWEFGKAYGARRDTLGALFIGLLRADGSGIQDVGKVGTGFKLAELQPLINRIEAWKADPASNPPLLIEVRYQGQLDSGKLRFPRYLGERTDITWQECTTDQLETA